MAVIVTLAVAAQTSGADDDRIAQLEKDMYRYFSSSATDSFMYITDQLIEACRKAGPSQERFHARADWNWPTRFTTTPTSMTVSSGSTRLRMRWPQCHRA